MRLFVLMIGIFLEACALPIDPSRQGDSYETARTYHKFLFAIAAREYAKREQEPIEISDLRKSVPPQPGDWAVCGRILGAGKVTYFAVFIRDRAIFDRRLAIGVDRCEEQHFVPFDNVELIFVPPSGVWSHRSATNAER